MSVAVGLPARIPFFYISFPVCLPVGEINFRCFRWIFHWSGTNWGTIFFYLTFVRRWLSRFFNKARVLLRTPTTRYHANSLWLLRWHGNWVIIVRLSTIVPKITSFCFPEKVRCPGGNLPFFPDKFNFYLLFTNGLGVFFKNLLLSLSLSPEKFSPNISSL